MKSAVRWLVAFLLFRALYSGEITYTLLNNTIKSFPHDIPQNVNKIVVQKTQITEIDYIEPFPNLTKMFIGKNALTKFPDLTNVSNSLQKCFLSQNDISVVDFFPKMKALQVLAIGSNKLTRLPDLTNISNTLEELYLENNQIIVVDGIPPMSVLKILKLSENRLTEFPDLRNAGSTLQELNLFENNITSFAEPLLRPMVALEILHLGAEYVMFPNVCAMGSSEKPLIIQLYSNQTICDLRAAYTKLAIETGRLVMEPTTWISSLICVEPGHLSGRLFSEVNIAEMVGTLKEHSSVCNVLLIMVFDTCVVKDFMLLLQIQQISYTGSLGT